MQFIKKIKSGIKHCTVVTLKISAIVAGDSTDKINFPHKLLLSDTQVSKLRQALSNNSCANIDLSKTQLHKRRKSGWFLGNVLGPLL